ncbi:hypothetical protein EDE08_103611 [Bradyrhizobium sp. R2.2-H]|jgi:hypothetical protein|nr:hypothetical protein EDE10_103610 [Bradyrhizobium sp. Y-H1]TCU78156.1 hypothetical protein EDE08_103611 [Bradyrhizobium sp. R2.2-H]
MRRGRGVHQFENASPNYGDMAGLNAAISTSIFNMCVVMVVAGEGYARAQPILRADFHCEGYGRPGGWVLVLWRVRHRASPIPNLGWAGDRLPIRYVACSPAICDPSSSIKPVGWVELLRNPSLVAISAAAIRDRLSEQSSKDRGVADRIAGDGFRKSSTHPTHCRRSSRASSAPHGADIRPDFLVGPTARWRSSFKPISVKQLV